jgi:hypothetical protein
MEIIKATIMGERPLSARAFILVVCAILFTIITLGGL